MCSSVVIALPPLEKLDGDTTCVLCEFVIKELQDIIGKNNTQQNILKALNKVCSILPRVIRSQCTSFVEKNAQNLINVLLEKLQPHQACVRLRMCSSLVHLKPVDESVESGDTTCVLCEYIIKELEDIIGNNNTQQNIVNALNKVCNILPRLVRSSCQNLVQNNAQNLIDILVKRLQPHQACIRLRMCS
jgi:saposin